MFVINHQVNQFPVLLSRFQTVCFNKTQSLNVNKGFSAWHILAW